MSTYLIVGAGAIGTSTAQQLAAQGHQVTIVTRSGSGPTESGITRASGDATDPRRVSDIAKDVDAIFNCANPPYHRWPTDWPPIANSLLRAAETSGAVLVTMSNLYVYGHPRGLMKFDDPLAADYEKAQVRITMWRDALAAHESGRARVSEVRASDFIGPNSQGFFTMRALPRIMAGKSCQVLGSPDMPHSWTYTADAAATLVACAQNPAAWGRAWHAVTNPPLTQREVIDQLTDLAGLAHVKVSSLPSIALRLYGLVNPLARELPKTMYQFTSPFVIDDAPTRQLLGLQPTPWSEVLRATFAPFAT